jgi:hypothetical protein
MSVFDSNNIIEGENREEIKEHEKCSLMCLWIVRFVQKMRKWDNF